MYQSSWQHPGLAFLLGGLGILLVVALRPWDARQTRRQWALLFALLQLEILVDAALTGALSPVPASGLLSQIVPVVFVISGDLRYFYLVERQRNDAENSRTPALLFALGFALIVPIGSGVVRWFFPSFFDGNRMFLIYELSLLAVACGHFALRAGKSCSAIYVRRLFCFELTQYALWATADVLILSGLDAGYALRIVPNVLYYVGFAPFAVLAAPDEARP